MSNIIALTNMDWRHVRAAFLFSKRFHFGQVRKNSTIPFFSHPLVVARMACDMATEYGLTESRAKIAVIALLHDTIEDSARPRMTREKIRELFGNDILKHVSDLTRIPGAPYRDYLCMAFASKETALVKICDRLHNNMCARLLKPNDKTRQKAIPKTDQIITQLWESTHFNHFINLELMTKLLDSKRSL